MLTYSDSLHTLTLMPTLDSEIRTAFPVIIEAFLVDYPDAKRSASFTITIEPCIVTGLSAVITPT